MILEDLLTIVTHDEIHRIVMFVNTAEMILADLLTV